MSVLRAEPVEARRKVIDSSEVAALFGLDERRTPFELWHRKAGNIPEPEVPEIDDERVFWGTVLGPAIAQGVAELQGWKIRKVQRQVEHPTVPGMGASLQYEICGHPRGPAALEIENIDWLVARDWVDGLPPLRFEIQAQHQLACLPRWSWAALGVLVGGNQSRVFEYERHPGAIATIERAVAAFWRSIEENRPPEPDFGRDLPALQALYGKPRPGSVRDLRGNTRLEALCVEYEEARRSGDEAEWRRKAAKAAILSIIQDTETVYCEGFKVLAGARPGGEVTYRRRPYRDFRVLTRGSMSGEDWVPVPGAGPASDAAAARARKEAATEMPVGGEDDDLSLPIAAHHLRILQAVVERDMPIDVLAQIVGMPLEEVSEEHSVEILRAIHAWEPETGKGARRALAGRPAPLVPGSTAPRRGAS